MKTLVLQSAPKEKLFCVALIPPGSNLAEHWRTHLPAYCIYDFDPAFSSDYGHIRFGDGSWLHLSQESLTELVLLPELDEDQMDQLGLFV